MHLLKAQALLQVKNAVASTTAQHGAGMLEVILSLDTVLGGDEAILQAWTDALAAAGASACLTFLAMLAATVLALPTLRQARRVGLCKPLSLQALIGCAAQAAE